MVRHIFPPHSTEVDRVRIPQHLQALGVHHYAVLGVVGASPREGDPVHAELPTRGPGHTVQHLLARRHDLGTNPVTGDHCYLEDPFLLHPIPLLRVLRVFVPFLLRSCTGSDPTGTHGERYPNPLPPKPIRAAALAIQPYLALGWADRGLSRCRLGPTTEDDDVPGSLPSTYQR